MKSGDLLTLREAADHIGIHHDTLRQIVANTKRLAKHGLPDPDGIAFRQFRKKGRIIFTRTDLDDYIARHTVDPANPPRIASQPIREHRRASQSPRIEIKRFW